MNFFTDTHAYCLFALSALEHRQSLLLRHNEGDRTTKVIEKYTQRGWDFLHTLDEAASDGGEDAMHALSNLRSMVGERWVDDKHTWILPIGATTPSRAQSSADTVDWMTAHSWDIIYSNAKATTKCKIFCDDPDHPARWTFANSVASLGFRNFVDKMVIKSPCARIDRTGKYW